MKTTNPTLRARSGPVAGLLACWMLVFGAAAASAETFTYTLAPAPCVDVTLDLGDRYGMVALPAAADCDPSGPAAVPKTFDLQAEWVYGTLTLTKGELTNVCVVTFSDHGDAFFQNRDDTVCDSVHIAGRHLGVGAPIPTPIKPSKYQPLMPERVFLVDWNAETGNMLFRGALPFTQGMEGQTVDFEGMAQTMEKQFSRQVDGAPFPKSFELVDVSLISNSAASEGPILYEQYKAFGGNKPSNDGTAPLSPDSFQPQRGEVDLGQGRVGRMLWWNVSGVPTPYDPGAPEGAVEAALAQTAPPFESGGPMHQQKPAPGLARALAQMMEEKSDRPRLIYLHCMSGQDRTGQMAASYLMAGREMPLPDAYVHGTTIMDAKGALKRFEPYDEPYRNAMRWTCHDLQQGTETSLRCADDVDRKSLPASAPWEGR